MATFVFTPYAWAHSSSDAFIRITQKEQSTQLTVSISVMDLQRRFDLDDNRDLNVTWGELKFHREAITEYFRKRIQIAQQTAQCQLSESGFGVDQLSDGMYGRLDFQLACPKDPLLPLSVTYDGLYEVDAQHRGLISFESAIHRLAGATNIDKPSFEFSWESKTARSLQKFVYEGIEHIFSGYDHMLFIVCLLLPAVYIRKDKRWLPQSSFGGASSEVLKALTAFTVSHSLTLALSTFALLPNIPRNLVELGIAASIFFTALNNVFVWFEGRQVRIAFLFGLVHGVGFSTVLNDLGLSGWELLWALLGFNLGIEIAQIIMVVIALPTNFLFRRVPAFMRASLFGGSIVTACFALLWIWQRLKATGLVG